MEVYNYDLYKNRCRFLLDDIYDKKDRYNFLNCYAFFKDLMSFTDFRKCKSIDCSRYKKRKRCFNKYREIEILSQITQCKMVFGTITFSDIFINDSYETNKKRIQRYLKNHYFYVIKNIDFGTKTDRLHYHFLGLTFDKIISTGKKSKKGRPMYNLENDSWKYGFAPNIEMIPYNYKDSKLVSNYLVKLNYHSNKISTRKSRLSILKNKSYLQKNDKKLATILFD